MRINLSRENLKKILEMENVSEIPFPQLYQLFIEEEELAEYVPDGICQMDPRNYDRILFNTTRSKRPHDNISDLSKRVKPSAEKKCIICEGETTGVIDVADLSEGFTFINKNLFPIVYPMGVCANVPSGTSYESTGLPSGKLACGFHFLQWTSSYHDTDWHNMSLEDRKVVIQRLAALEEKLLKESISIIPKTDPWDDPDGYHGFVSIVKNYGALVGGSLAHGHQQIALTNIMPNDCLSNLRFERGRGETFSAYMQRISPPGLVIRNYENAVLILPFFMRRPYEMMLFVKNHKKKYLHQLSEGEVESLAEGLYDAINAIHYIMPRLGREIAYNLVLHNGPGAGIYLDFHPYTQELGGFEHLGLFVCQGNPPDAAKYLREVINASTKDSSY